MAPTPSLLAGVGLAVLGTSHAVRTYLEHRETAERRSARTLATDGGGTDTDPSSSVSVSPGVIDRERVRAYREIMAAIIKLNRCAVEMGAPTLREEADLLVHDGDSDLAEPHANVTQTYQSYFHIISPSVRDAVSSYADYLVTYHDDGAQAGELLSLSGGVAEAMRNDLGLESLFEQNGVGQSTAGTDSDTDSEDA